MIEREVMKGDEKSAHTAPSIEYVIAMPADVVELRAAATEDGSSHQEEPDSELFVSTGQSCV
jgi:hypothetical protein